jgi:hypothetical protein
MLVGVLLKILLVVKINNTKIVIANRLPNIILIHIITVVVFLLLSAIIRILRYRDK